MIAVHRELVLYMRQCGGVLVARSRSCMVLVCCHGSSVSSVSHRIPLGSMARHSWEEPDDLEAPPGFGAHSWEEGESADGDSADSDEGEHVLDPADELLEYLMSLFLDRTLSAKDLCTISWCASKSWCARVWAICLSAKRAERALPSAPEGCCPSVGVAG